MQRNARRYVRYGGYVRTLYPLRCYRLPIYYLPLYIKAVTLVTHVTRGVNASNGLVTGRNGEI